MPILKLGSFGFDFRIACCVSRIALGDWLCLGLFLGVVEGRFVFINLCGNSACVGFGAAEIGFVSFDFAQDSLRSLHN